jgi:DNA-binding MarR family transcriptional regulator
MYSIDNSLGFVIGKIFQRINELFQKDLAVIGITPKQYGILIVVSSNNDITQKKAAEALKLDRTTIGQQIDLLESKELLIRVHDKNDKRAYNLKLTAKGKNVVETLWQKMQDTEHSVISSLSKEQQIQFLELTKIIYQSEVNINE